MGLARSGRGRRGLRPLGDAPPRPSSSVTRTATNISPRPNTAARARKSWQTDSLCHTAAGNTLSATPIRSLVTRITRGKPSPTQPSAWRPGTAAFRGRRTANGEIYDMASLTAAHPTMPLPCYARVTNLGNGYSVIVAPSTWALPRRPGDGRCAPRTCSTSRERAPRRSRSNMSGARRSKDRTTICCSRRFAPTDRLPTWTAIGAPDGRERTRAWTVGVRRFFRRGLHRAGPTPPAPAAVPNAKMSASRRVAPLPPEPVRETPPAPVPEAPRAITDAILFSRRSRSPAAVATVRPRIDPRQTVVVCRRKRGRRASRSCRHGDRSCRPAPKRRSTIPISSRSTRSYAYEGAFQSLPMG